MPKFTPIEEDTSTWKPLPAEIQASGPTPSAQDILPKAPPHVSGGEPTPGDPSADILRYGVPTAVGLATGGASLPVQMALGGLSTGLSEITARQIERASTDPDLDEIWKDIQAGGAIAGADVAITGALEGLTRGVFAAGRRMLLPREMPPDVELAQTVLGRGKGKATNLWRSFKGQKDPFSLTLGQLNSEERGLVTFLESVARGGTGRGIMTRFDSRNAKHMAEAIDKYLDARIRSLSPRETGAFMNKLIGFSKDPANAVKPVEAVKSFLYRRYDEALEQIAHEPIDGTALRNFIRGAHNKDLIKVFGEAKSTGLLPPLEGIETKVVRRSRTTTHRTARDEGVNVADVTRKNLLDPGAEPVRTATETQAKRESAKSGVVSSERITELLVDPRLSAEQVDDAWKNLSPNQVDKTMRVINSYYDKFDKDKLNKSLMAMKETLDKPLEKVLNRYPTIKTARDTANTYFGQKEAALFNDVVKSIRKKIALTPSGIDAILNPLRGDAGVAYDKLMKIKEGLFFSGEVGETARSLGISKSGQSVRKRFQQYENSVLRPLRFRFVEQAKDAHGRLDPSKVLTAFEKIKLEAPEMINELWGGPEQANKIMSLMSTYDTLLKSNPESSIFIQLATAGAIGGLGGAAWSLVTGDDPKVSAGIGAATVLLSPIVLARTLTNPRLTRALTDGLSESTRSGGITPLLAMTFRKMGEMKVASNLFRDNPSTDTMQFYNFAPIEEVEQ